MDSLGVGIVALFIVAFAFVSRRLSSTILTPQIIFVGFGVVIGNSVLDIVDLSFDNGVVITLAELTLVLVLFTDAARIRLRGHWAEQTIPLRMLGIGMPLIIVAGAVFALVLFDTLSIWEALLLAAILAPTDAALGQVIMLSKSVPRRIRDALNVESGLNDGLAAVFIAIFAAFAIADQDFDSIGEVVPFIAKQIGYGTLIGIAIGYGGGALERLSERLHAATPVFRQLAILSLAIAAYALSIAAGGNGFIAAFVAGLAFGAVSGIDTIVLTEFTDDEGQLLELITFLLFGGVVVGPAISQITWEIAVYALLSLTVIRMIPIALSLIGARCKWSTLFTLGWFGPRGLASMIFGLVILEESHIVVADEIFLVVTWVVVFSVVAHGMTAAPIARAYAAHPSEAADPDDAAPGLPTRHTVALLWRDPTNSSARPNSDG